MKRKIRLTGKIAMATILVALIAASLGSAYSAGRQVSAASDPIAVGNWQYDQFDSIILQDANSFGLNPFIVKGQIMLESNFNQWAQSSQINWGCGGTHDLGLMQVNPYCNGLSASSLFVASTNIYYGCKELASAYYALGDINLALQAYNIGTYSVEAGQRNWAYSNEVDSYANQFQSEHNSLYGSSTPTYSTSGSGTTYTVQPGDTLSAIASRYGISYQSIAQANGIGYPYIIYVGQHLKIPTTSGSGSWVYTVSSGDTLSAIGSRYGVSWSSIAQVNGISYPYIIYPGQHLTIP